MTIRVEHDSLGPVDIPEQALYGPQTQRAVNNFPISGQPLPVEFIRGLILIKKAAAQANGALDCISTEQQTAIEQACDYLLADKHLMTHFPVDIFQTGSGTSSNMNANEVIATLANRHCTEAITANDHVNYGQSSNDVIPTAIHVSAALLLHSQLLPALKHLDQVIQNKAASLAHVCKTGRTHLMDALPIRFDQALSAWSGQINQCIHRLEGIQAELHTLAQGGTAVGTGVNAHADFAEQFCEKLSALTDKAFTPSDNFFTLISSQDTAVALSGQLKTLACALMKITNDLRWMNSGPLAGLSEVTLPALQPGSSIMPGKVNPVIPEAVAMVAAQVIGNDAAITLGGQSGNFELNVMLPMIAANLLSSLSLLSNASRQLADKAIDGFAVNEDVIAAPLERNPILVTALNPIIGYDKAAKIAKRAYSERRPVIDVALEETDLSKDELKTLLDPLALTRNQ